MATLQYPALIGGACLGLVLLGRVIEVPAGRDFLPAIAIPLFATLFLRRAGAYALALSFIFAAGVFYPSVHGDNIERRRSFFGVHRVTLDREANLVKLVHGNTVHGLQSSTKSKEPLAYYHRGSPIAAVIEKMESQGRLKSIGVVGLGSGALAAYGRPGQTWTFFEIDPDVKQLAQRHFTYLAKSQAEVRIVLGDARLSLAHAKESFDLLVIDAFGSDSIPLHLLTREAMAIYADHLNPGGVIAFHISNRYLDLFPVIAAMGDGDRPEDQWSGWRSDTGAWLPSQEDQKAGRLSSWWAVLTRDPRDAAGICTPPPRWSPLVADRSFRPWTNDFVNLPAAIRWRELLTDE